MFEKNVIVGATAASYPPGNFFPSGEPEVGFADDYRLKSDSAYAKKGTDGKDRGADFDALTKATSGVIVGP